MSVQCFGCCVGVLPRLAHVHSGGLDLRTNLTQHPVKYVVKSRPTWGHRHFNAVRIIQIYTKLQVKTYSYIIVVSQSSK